MENHAHQENKTIFVCELSVIFYRIANIARITDVFKLLRPTDD